MRCRSWRRRSPKGSRSRSSALPPGSRSPVRMPRSAISIPTTRSHASWWGFCNQFAPCRLGGGVGAAGQGLQSVFRVRGSGTGQDPSHACDRALHQGAVAQYKADVHVLGAVHERADQLRFATTRRFSFERSTAMSTSCSSTTSSFWRGRSGPRRSSFIPSMHCMTRKSRS